MSSIISDAKQQEMNLVFEFQNFPGKLVIRVQAKDAIYRGEVLARPGLNFKHLRESFQNKEFIVVTKRSDILRLTVAGLDFDFENFDKITIAELEAREAESRREVIRLNLLVNEKNNEINSKNREIENMAQAYAELRSRFAEIEKIENCTAKQNRRLNSEIENLTLAQTRFSHAYEALENKNQQSIAEITKLNQIINSNNQKTQKIMKLAERNLPFQQLYTCSKIVTNKTETDNLGTYFHKRICGMKLLYRASENNFSARKFHDKCDNIPNTLVLCETEFNKKIGGFTPLTWESPEKAEYKKDESGESFIFSLTHNDKFILEDKRQAIQNNKNCGPTFSLALHISECENKEKYSFGLINTIYFNQNYKSMTDKTTNQRFSGNPKGDVTFLMKEWQVWELEWAQENQRDQEKKQRT